MAHAVRFEEVTKRYPRGWTEGEEPRYASLRHDLASVGKRLSSRARGRPARETGALALKDVSFEIEEGESFAIIGPNGAGKSTALKLISRISYPTSGRIRIRGRVAALMEVGSGVHPELTGRENIWLYGQILGMTKADIRRRFDEIVDFSELGGAIDTPVKFFSSGMQLRLGFSIAAHLEPDVFVVDEALAVGDAGFQAKCVERMTKLTREGHTLLFVSHDLSAIEAVCERGMFLLDGQVAAGNATRRAEGVSGLGRFRPSGASVRRVSPVPVRRAPVRGCDDQSARARNGTRSTPARTWRSAFDSEHPSPSRTSRKHRDQRRPAGEPGALLHAGRRWGAGRRSRRHRVRVSPSPSAAASACLRAVVLGPLRACVRRPLRLAADRRVPRRDIGGRFGPAAQSHVSTDGPVFVEHDWEVAPCR